ncbi:LPXTG-site transpeptidase (sortase) family protein [Streptomyces phaeochromogenes]|jgi:LPXTG-site transpeptidase (sortase) family protein|uniref:class F sortase n=1 Tax=Streptomyces TaxID=1883 RepID=UPI00117EB64B|nr:MULTISPECIES: class F sortase [Streptomyces]MDQ0950493.1 LPXTG-site transpeptidase (sortase) family protein [Streptomyces phaeochromogenes]TRO62355.1 class F sortase [Streptomyces sp. IB201691-2A2]
MTLPSRHAPSRRAFVTAALASLLVSCDGQQADRSTDDRSGAGKTGNSQPPAKAAKALGRSVPVRLQVPSIQVDTPVMRLGLASDGTVEVPPIAADDKAGWYEHSPTPGQVGPSVILGHVTVGSYGDGVFHHLSRLRRGDRIVARLENGRAAEFAVTDVRTVAQAEFPTKEVYGNVGSPELRLITCGGPRTGDGYRDSVIVFAALSSDNP